MAQTEFEIRQRIGQQVCDLIGAEMEAAASVDLTVVLDILAAVIAHYIAGIEGEEQQILAFEGLSNEVIRHVQHLNEKRPDAKARVAMGYQA